MSDEDGKVDWHKGIPLNNDSFAYVNYIKEWNSYKSIVALDLSILTVNVLSADLIGAKN
jgi:hypothetical protein